MNLDTLITKLAEYDEADTFTVNIPVIITETYTSYSSRRAEVPYAVLAKYLKNHAADDHDKSEFYKLAADWDHHYEMNDFHQSFQNCTDSEITDETPSDNELNTIFLEALNETTYCEHEDPKVTDALENLYDQYKTLTTLKAA